MIGGGPGGYVAAIRAAQLGLKTACVEREHLGGICLNWGCIPTKALLRTAEVAHLIERAEEFGIKAKLESIDLKKVIARSRAVAGQLSKGVSGLMKKHKITVIDGHGRLDGLAAGRSGHGAGAHVDGGRCDSGGEARASEGLALLRGLGRLGSKHRAGGGGSGEGGHIWLLQEHT